MKPTLLLWIAVLFCSQWACAGEKPNIVFILADNLGSGDLGCYCQQQIQTPCLDRVAHEGLRFTRFYAGYTVCLPSRCALTTGLHTGHARCRKNGVHGTHPQLSQSDTTIATMSQATGYTSGMTGKHLAASRLKQKNQ